MEIFPLASAGFHLAFWAMAQNTKFSRLEVGLNDKITPWRSLAAGRGSSISCLSKELEGIPVWHTKKEVM